MSSPIHRQVLTPKKPIWVYRLEQKIAAQDERIRSLEDALETVTLENKRLRGSRITRALPVPETGQPKGGSEIKNGSPLFQMSL